MRSNEGVEKKKMFGKEEGRLLELEVNPEIIIKDSPRIAVVGGSSGWCRDWAFA
jgi:hypothetical protein